ncbi:hypothetical protein A9Q81_11570 [Gammaproteobacteria bacterium 42_54_T18]|nr:hypothetical protein A9Q81_11570 [Gammaproteobacteria bacterium 42_54_T18]
MIRKLYLFGLLCGVASASLAAEPLKICTDVNFWYPFTFVKDGKPVGLHLDIISRAADSVGVPIEYTPLPWKRCLKEVEGGSYDGIAVASYKDARAEFMHYPDDSVNEKRSVLRVMQVEYVVVTPAFSRYEYTGDVTTLPTPVRIPRGYSIADDLKKKGVNVDSGAAGDENNIRKMLRAGKGSLVTLPQIVEVLGVRPEFKDKLKVSAKPLKSKSYYLTFSKKGKATVEIRKSLWREIAVVRENAVFMEAASSKY